MKIHNPSMLFWVRLGTNKHVVKKVLYLYEIYLKKMIREINNFINHYRLVSLNVCFKTNLWFKWIHWTSFWRLCLQLKVGGSIQQLVLLLDQLWACHQQRPHPRGAGSLQTSPELYKGLSPGTADSGQQVPTGGLTAGADQSTIDINTMQTLPYTYM